MRQGVYRAGLELAYPDTDCSLDAFRALKRWTKCRPTASDFPWHLARPLYACLCKATPSFAFAELTLLCKGEAARRVFAPSKPGYRRWIVAAVTKHRPQIAGIFYEHLRYRVTATLIRRGLNEWPECEDLIPPGGGRDFVTPEELEINRRALLAVIADAARWYERTLTLIGIRKNLDGRASGHELHHWIGGAGMPEPVRVPVTVEEGPDGTMLIGPDTDEAKPIVDAGWDLPEYPVEDADLEIEPPPLMAPAPAATETKARPTEREIAAARMLQSGLLVSAGPLLERMKPNERALANYLLSHKHPAKRIPLSYAEIGQLLGCSDETVRRRQRSLEQKHPPLKRLIAAARSRNLKGASLPSGISRDAFDEDPEPR